MGPLRTRRPVPPPPLPPKPARSMLLGALLIRAGLLGLLPCCCSVRGLSLDAHSVLLSSFVLDVELFSADLLADLLLVDVHVGLEPHAPGATTRVSTTALPRWRPSETTSRRGEEFLAERDALLRRGSPRGGPGR